MVNMGDISTINLGSSNYNIKDITARRLANQMATQTQSGRMSTEDKKKLDNIAEGAEVNQNAYSKVVIAGSSQQSIQASSKQDTITLNAGNNVNITAGSGNSITISSIDTNTDTKNTTGTTNLTATKLYLAGATSQAANPQTYSNVNVYIGTDNCLYSGGAKVLTAHQSLAYYVNTVTTTGSGNVVSDVSKSGTTITVTKDVTALTAHQAIYDLTIQGNGTTIGTFDPNGSAKTINITPANIGAAAAGHTHSYLPLSGGAMTGLLTVLSNDTASGINFRDRNANITSIQNSLLLRSTDGIRFGGWNTWDWDVWAGLKYNSSTKTVYLGIADRTNFFANNAQTGGTLRLPGITSIYTGSGTAVSLNGHTHSYLPLSGGTLTGNLTCQKNLYSDYLKSLDGSSNIYIGDSENSAYVTFVEDMHGEIDGEQTWMINNQGNAYLYSITTNNYNPSTSRAVIGPSGIIELYANTPLIDFHYNNSTSDYSTRIVCDTSTRLSVIATTFRASNAITCVSLTQTSDERLKENIKDVDDEFVDNLFSTDNGYIHQFDFKDSKRHSNGIIAQEVKDIMPEVVDYDETDDVYRVDYTSASMKLIGAMFKKIKELENEIVTMKEEIEKLKNK